MLCDRYVASDTDGGHGGPLVFVNFLTLNQLLILPGGLISHLRLRFYLQMQLSVLDGQGC